MNRVLAWIAGLFGCAVPPPAPVTAPPAPPGPALRAVEAEAEVLRNQDAERERLRKQLAAFLQSGRQYDARQQDDARPPAFARDLDGMVHYRLTNIARYQPADAARYLTAFVAREADAVFERRLEDIAVLLGDGPATDGWQRDLAWRVGQLSAEARKEIRGVLTGEARTAVTREVLTRLRAGRVGADASLRYVRAVEDPQWTTVAVLALLAPDATLDTVAHWKAAPVRLGFLRSEPLTLAEVEGFLNALVRHGLTDPAKLREERDRQTADLLAGRTAKPFQIGLAGTDTAVVEDLTKLLHAPTRDRLQRRLR